MRRTTLLTTILALALAGPAAAQEAKPAPCSDNFIEDAAGDPSYDASGLGLLATDGTPEMDITKVFFTVSNGVISGNLEIANLAKKVPGEATGGLYYYFFYGAKGGEQYVVARVLDSSTVEFRHGTYDASTGTYFNDSEKVDGKLHEGAGGVVSMSIPASDGLAVGTEIAQIRGTVDLLYGNDDETGLNVHADEAPNDGGSASLIAAPCTATPPGAQPAPSPAGPGQPSTLTALPFRAPAFIGKASKARKGKTLTLAVEALKPIKSLKVTLKASSGKGATLATGSLASLPAKGKLKLKLKRKLKKGRYALLATGTVDGQKLKSAQQVAIR